MADDFSVRLAHRDDAPAIAALSRDRIEQGLGWSWTAPRVLRSIGDRGTNVAVAQHGDQRLGFGIMKYHDDEAHLLLLAVHADAGRRGVGSALVRWLEQSALIAGVGQVYLEARLTNGAARAFYARLGYREIQTLPGYYQGREACVRLAKDLWLAPVERG
ncbi:MAG: GNAT family N-acetyltransferase [Solirubrobacteraceae bacterium]|nr:GNAT family N-acetyltransferase [Solirubrobacteraceae bacterium]